MEGEVLSIRNSRKIYIPVYVMIIVLLTSVVIIKFQNREISSFALKSVAIFSATGVIWTEMHRLRNKYEITDNAVVHINGLFFRTIKKTDIHALSDAQLKQNPLQLILGIGDVIANAFSETTFLKNINNPHKVIEFLEGKMTKKTAQQTNARNRREK